MPQDDRFQYKTYKCGWVARVYTVDQYGFEGMNSETWYETFWPTREEAVEALASVTTPAYPRPLYPGAKHGYYDSGVGYREKLVESVK